MSLPVVSRSRLDPRRRLAIGLTALVLAGTVAGPLAEPASANIGCVSDHYHPGERHHAVRPSSVWKWYSSTWAMTGTVYIGSSYC